MESAKASLQRHFSRAANRIPQMQVLEVQIVSPPVFLLHCLSEVVFCLLFLCVGLSFIL